MPANMKAIQPVEVFRKSYALDATNDTNVDVTEGFPEGLIRALIVRIYSNACTGLGAAASTYLGLVKSLSAGSSAHGAIYNNIKGLLWDDFWTAYQTKATERTAPTTSGFSFMLYIPFALPGTPRHPQFRPNDTALLNIRNKAKPYLNLILGPHTTLGTTISACTATVEVIALVEPRPQAGPEIPGQPLQSGDEPTRQLEVMAFQKSDMSVSSLARFNTGLQRAAAFLFFRELDNTAAKVTDIFTLTAANASKFEVSYGTERYINKVKLTTLDRMVADREGAALPASCHLVNFIPDGKLTDSLDCSEGRDFFAEFDNVATSTNRVLEFMPIYHKPVNDKATYAALSAA